MLFYSLLFFLALGDQSKGSFSMSHIFPIEVSHSYIGFKIGYMGVGSVRGRFNKYSATVYYDAADIQKTSVTLSIESESLETENDWRNKDLKSDKWFDVKQFPSIEFQSSSVEQKKEGFTLYGNLKIRDKSKQIAIQMKKPSDVLEDARKDLMVVFSGTLKINRQDFEVTGKRWGTVVADTVEIELNILCKQIQNNNMKLRIRNPKNIAGQIYKKIEGSSVQEGLKFYEALKKDGKTKNWMLNTVAYVLLTGGKVDEAIQLFEYNRDEQLNNGNSYDSLGEAYAIKGDLEKAKKYYQKALDLDPKNMNAKEVLRHL